MINTFHTSFNPPPVPPRQGHRGPTLARNTPLVKFLAIMLLLLMLLTFGGFLYLFHTLSKLQDRSSSSGMVKMLQQCMEDSTQPDDMLRCKMLVKGSQTGGKMAFLAGTGSSTIPQASMVLLPDSTPSPGSKSVQMDTLTWDSKHSRMEMISLGKPEAITIQFPGYYFVYSQVTFSKRHIKAPLKQVIWTRKLTGTENELDKGLVAYCSLPQNPPVPDLCTTSQTGVFRLEHLQQLFVNVTDRSLVNTDNTIFKLFKLRD